MQFRPRLTGESGSPWVATTRSFCTPISTEQPVPQKRQGILSQRTLVLSADCAWTTAGKVMPAVVAAAATALALMKSRRFMLFISGNLVGVGGFWFKGVVAVLVD